MERGYSTEYGARNGLNQDHDRKRSEGGFGRAHGGSNSAGIKRGFENADGFGSNNYQQENDLYSINNY